MKSLHCLQVRPVRYWLVYEVGVRSQLADGRYGTYVDGAGHFPSMFFVASIGIRG